MRQSRYLIQVFDRETNAVVQWAPGQPVEREFVTELVNRVKAKGVGIGCTADHVAKDLERAISELLLDLKRQV